MARHTPYQRRHQEPVYIGFEAPRKRTNGFGVAGFVMSILGVLSFGLLSPVALLLSMIGLRRGPRGFAMTGTLLGGLGTAFWGLIFYAAISASHADRHQARYHQQNKATMEVIEKVNYQVNEFIIESEGELPDELEGNRFAVAEKDAWNNELKYELKSDGFSIKSAGPDKKFNTRDDIAKKFTHEVERTNARYMIEL